MSTLVQMFASAENRIQLQNIKSVCNNLYYAFENLLSGQDAAFDIQKKKSAEELAQLQEQLQKTNNRLAAAQDGMEMLKEDLKRMQEEKATLQELNEALKGQNEALTDQIELLKENRTEATKKAATKRKTPTVKTDHVAKQE